ncbi:sulfotransferase family protein [Psychroserpens burtonensis]|uniref:sulfotransferase family protein n=1 Tax=Psychroserpens burtonensis TaxID=49278 RepID=UPI000405E6F0|nr:sulfotransferase [Psychroserpens burtonensis]
MNKKQFFILGNPRSGTSLLRLMLNNHSNITVPPECGFLLWLAQKYNSWNVININKIDIDNFISDVQASKKFETWNISNLSLFEVISRNQPKNYIELVQCVYLAYAKLDDKEPQFLGDKNNYYINHLEDIITIIPDSYIIHLVRDGRDVANSYREINGISKAYKYKPTLPYSISEIANDWNKANLSIFDFFHNYKNYIYIRYEDLVLNSEKTLNEILNKLGLTFETEMKEFYISNALRKIEPEETIAWKLKTLSPLDPSNIGIYKKKLSLTEIEEFNEIAKKSLKLFDYNTEC